MISPHPAFSSLEELQSYVLTHSTIEELEYYKVVHIKNIAIPFWDLFPSDQPKPRKSEKTENQPIKTALKLIIFIFFVINLSFTNKLDYGKVKFYSEEKKFGYIIDNQTKDELYVYEICLVDEIKKNDFVSYKKRDTRKGLEAFDVRLIK